MSEVLRTGFVVLIPMLRRYAVHLTGSGTSAEDLLQDTLVRMWRFRTSYNESLPLKAWVMKIMRNEFLRQRSKRSTTIEDVEGGVENLRACAPEQEERVMSVQLLEALDELPEKGRAALLLAAQGFSCEESSVLLGCSVGTVKSRVSRAREQLRACA